MIHLGTDIVEVYRIRKLLDRWSTRFLRHTFTDPEIDYCNNQLKPAVHFAGRFAAKEAVKKALYASGRTTPVGFTSIAINRTPEGVPRVLVDGYSNGALQVSISHTAEHAVATAIYNDDA
ncbi:MAG: holo-ACP synthase [Candidatus Marinimicrobia bacterium]|nr:holo-ACP synthase [Candidatus Neomarinimicrobiota bacterium]